MKQASPIVTKLSKSLPWAFVESIISAATSLLTVLLVAYFLKPDEFGLAGIAIAVCAIVQSLLLGGMSDAINRSPTVHTTLTDSFFWIVIAVGIVATAVCIAIGFVIGSLNQDTIIVKLISAQAVTCFLFAISAVPTGLLLRKMRTRKLAVRTLTSKIAGMVTTIGFAVAGYGAWSLIIGNIVNQLAGTVQLVASMNRLPRFTIALKQTHDLIKISMLAGAQQTLNTITTRGFIIAFGAVYGPYAVGIFNFALRLVEESGNVINNTLRQVAVATFASAQRTGVDVQPLFIKGTKLIVYISAPIFIGGAVVAQDAIPLIFGKKWAPAVPAIQILLVMWMVRSTRLLAPALMLAHGAGSPLVWSALAGMIMTALAFGASLFFNSFWSTASYAAMLIGAMPSGLYFLKRISRISIEDQLKACLMPTLFATLMAIALIMLRHLLPESLPIILQLVILISFGVILFVSLASIFDRSGVREIKRYLIK
jgi:teichuronic acid exporter